MGVVGAHRKQHVYQSYQPVLPMWLLLLLTGNNMYINPTNQSCQCGCCWCSQETTCTSILPTSPVNVGVADAHRKQHADQFYQQVLPIWVLLMLTGNNMHINPTNQSCQCGCCWCSQETTCTSILPTSPQEILSHEKSRVSHSHWSWRKHAVQHQSVNQTDRKSVV